jgi:hypothetical protein
MLTFMVTSFTPFAGYDVDGGGRLSPAPTSANGSGGLAKAQVTGTR